MVSLEHMPGKLTGWLNWSMMHLAEIKEKYTFSLV